MPLGDGEGVEVGLLGVLGLDGTNEGLKVGDILLGLGPFLLGEELVLDAELGRAADAVDAVVGLSLGQALEGGENGLVLLGDQVVGPAVREHWLPGFFISSRGKGEVKSCRPT